ncbi:uncharacterized protein [Argopecten irradians]|uniref:uncharacterized protein n=1 Tax=Argopecten irradians TaxID=31199 RepID=UPI003718F56A
MTVTVRMTNAACYRCGDKFVPNHVLWCPANGCYCFMCGNIGHFSRVCFRRTGYRTENISTTGSSPWTRQCPNSFARPVSAPKKSSDRESDRPTSPRKKTKSTSKRRRDSERLRNYREIKKVQKSFPFYELSIIELTAVLKTDMKQDNLKCLTKKNKRLVSTVEILQRQCNNFQYEITTLKDCVSELQNSQDNIASAWEKQFITLKIEHQNTIRKLHSRDIFIEDLQASLSIQKEEFRTISLENSRLIQLNTNLGKEISRLKRNNKECVQTLPSHSANYMHNQNTCYSNGLPLEPTAPVPLHYNHGPYQNKLSRRGRFK